MRHWLESKKKKNSDEILGENKKWHLENPTDKVRTGCLSEGVYLAPLKYTVTSTEFVRGKVWAILNIFFLTSEYNVKAHQVLKDFCSHGSNTIPVTTKPIKKRGEKDH